jgi:hypothetical protein
MRLASARARLEEKNTAKRRLDLEVAQKSTLRAIDRAKGRSDKGKK